MKSSLFLALAPAVVQAWKVANQGGGGSGYIDYTTVAGFFKQDDPDTDPSTFDYATENFGLLDIDYPTDSDFDPSREKTQWQRFEYYVESLNHGCHRDRNVRYKVLYMGRHGEGWHNAAESYYGTPAWNCYWSELTGNGTAIWADPLLTPAGEDQTVKASSFFSSKFKEGLPAPESYYSSPLSRCTTTANLTFAALDLPPSRPFAPIIKELLREGISIHTCDRRSTKSEIMSLFQQPEQPPNPFVFEPGFTERDELWDGLLSESRSAQAARSKTLLDDIFVVSHAETWLSITSHSGEIRTLLAVLAHRPFRLATGQIIPVLVRARYVEDGDNQPPTTTEPWVAEATCDSPPITSLADGGCVCSSAITTTTEPVAVIT